MAAAILVGIALLLLAGSATLFDSIHAIPNQDPSTELMRDRFWGGPGLYFHPNSMAGLAIIAAIRISPDRRFAAWQRLVAVVVAGFVLYESNSRIGFVFFAAAALVHVALLVLRRLSPDRVPEDLPRYRRPWLAAIVPFLVLAMVLVLSGGQGFLTRSRFGGDDMSSGRLDTWRQVYHDWQGDGLPEKLFGNADTSRAVVKRATSDRQLNTDNAAVGAFRRGGVLGAIAFLIGLVLLLWHALRPVLRRGPPSSGSAWFIVAALAAVPTIATEDWLLGGTNGAIWLILMAGEAVAVWVAGRSTAPEPATAVSAR
jgi:O-antigen ligase